MLREHQIKEIAKQNSINPYYQEKDYLLTVFLRSIGKQGIIFKGGTCLKLCYNLPRFSEDLDFNIEISPQKMKEIVSKSLSAFQNIGIDVEVEREELFDEAYTATLRCKGPLYKGRKDSTNTIQIDAGKRLGTECEPLPKQIISPYQDIPSFFLRVMDIQEILAEKIAAAHSRKKGRDLFDIWFLSKQTTINRELLQKKMSGESIELPAEQEYTRDMDDLVPTAPPYKNVKQDVMGYLQDAGLHVQ